jgi:hypothetical protein
MTVCIAATCENDKNIIVAADRMFTVGPPLNVEFEPPLTKIETMGSACVAMGAGNGLYVSEIFRRARADYHNVDTVPVSQIASSLNNVYSQFRDEKLEEQIIRPMVGPDFMAFRARGGTLPAYLQVQPGIYQQLVVQSSQFNLGVDIVLAGIDDGGTHLYYLGHPGGLISFGKIGYNVVGSGATHVAIKFALELQHPRCSLADTLLNVYSAKKAAEVAPGVGQQTEMKVISSDGVWPAPSTLIETVEKVRRDGNNRSKPDVDAIAAKYGELRKDSRNHEGPK